MRYVAQERTGSHIDWVTTAKGLSYKTPECALRAASRCGSVRPVRVVDHATGRVVLLGGAGSFDYATGGRVYKEYYMHAHNPEGGKGDES